jgi:hypothetical protein
MTTHRLLLLAILAIYSIEACRQGSHHRDFLFMILAILIKIIW